MCFIIDLIDLFLKGSNLLIFLIKSGVDIFEVEFVLIELIG